MLWVTLALGLLIAAAMAQADEIPGFGGAPFYYYSTDRRPVEVVFAQFRYNNETSTYKIGHTDPATKKFIEGVPIAVATLPRAYINRLSPYTSGSGAWHEDFRQEILPDKIVGNSLMMTMTYPDGLPYSTVYDTWPLHRPSSETGLVTGEFARKKKKDEVRSLLLWVSIEATSYGNSRDNSVLEPKKLEYLGMYEGFKRYKHKFGTLEVFFADDADEIRRIQCSRGGTALQFCEYRVPLNPHLTAVLNFIDFRLHGGRAFARERIRAFKRIMCPVFKCDERALKAAEIK